MTAVAPAAAVPPPTAAAGASQVVSLSHGETCAGSTEV